MKKRTLNWLKGRLSSFKLAAIYLAILISLTFFVSAYGTADVSYRSDDYPQLNRYEDVEVHKTAEGGGAAAKANKARKAGDAARAAQKASKAAKRASEARNARRSAENAVDNAKKRSGSRAGSSKGGKTGAVGGGKPTVTGVNIVGTTHDTIRPTQKFVKQSAVESYREQIRKGKSLEPITVYDFGSYGEYIDDGHHRYVAYKLEGYADADIPMNVNYVIQDSLHPLLGGPKNWKNIRYVDDYGKVIER